MLPRLSYRHTYRLCRRHLFQNHLARSRLLQSGQQKQITLAPELFYAAGNIDLLTFDRSDTFGEPGRRAPLPASARERLSAPVESTARSEPLD